jgi:hypothetical protein
VFPKDFASLHRRDLISRLVGALNAKWWAGIVDHMIITNNHRFDIDAAARSERVARLQVQTTKEVSAAYESFARNMSDSGLDDTLKKFNASTIWEAVEHAKKKEGADDDLPK